MHKMFGKIMDWLFGGTLERLVDAVVWGDYGE